MPANLTLPPIVLVVWRDAMSVEASDPTTPVTPGLCELAEVGWFLAEDDESIVIGMEQSIEGVDPGRWRLHIPKANIQSIDILTRKRARKPKPEAKASEA